MDFYTYAQHLFTHISPPPSLRWIVRINSLSKPKPVRSSEGGCQSLHLPVVQVGQSQQLIPVYCKWSREDMWLRPGQLQYVSGDFLWESLGKMFLKEEWNCRTTWGHVFCYMEKKILYSVRENDINKEKTGWAMKIKTVMTLNTPNLN